MFGWFSLRCSITGENAVPPLPLYATCRGRSSRVYSVVSLISESHCINCTRSGLSSCNMCDVSVVNCVNSSSDTEPDVSTAIAISSRQGLCKDGRYSPEPINRLFGLAHVKSDLLLDRKKRASTFFQSTLGSVISEINVSMLADSLPWALACSAAWLTATVRSDSIALALPAVPSESG